MGFPMFMDMDQQFVFRLLLNLKPHSLVASLVGSVAAAGLSIRGSSLLASIVPAQATADALTCASFISWLLFDLSMLDTVPKQKHNPDILLHQINLSS